MVWTREGDAAALKAYYVFFGLLFKDHRKMNNIIFLSSF